MNLGSCGLARAARDARSRNERRVGGGRSRWRAVDASDIFIRALSTALSTICIRSRFLDTARVDSSLGEVRSMRERVSSFCRARSHAPAWTVKKSRRLCKVKVVFAQLGPGLKRR